MVGITPITVGISPTMVGISSTTVGITPRMVGIRTNHIPAASRRNNNPGLNSQITNYSIFFRTPKESFIIKILHLSVLYYL